MNAKASPRVLSDVRQLFASLGEFPEPVEKPVFIALSGLPGTGKSYFSRQIAGRLPLVILESDALRKVLFPHPAYDWRESARLFQACYSLIEILLKNGISLIFDATNLSERHRKKLYDIAFRLRLKLILVRIKAPSRVIRERLQERKKHNYGFSDADWTVYLAMKPRVERIGQRHYVVDTSKNITSIIEKIVQDVKSKES